MPKVSDDDIRLTLSAAMCIEHQLAAYCLKIIEDDELLEKMVEARNLAGTIVGGLVRTYEGRRKKRAKYSELRAASKW